MKAGRRHLRISISSAVQPARARDNAVVPASPIVQLLRNGGGGNLKVSVVGCVMKDLGMANARAEGRSAGQIRADAPRPQAGCRLHILLIPNTQTHSLHQAAALLGKRRKSVGCRKEDERLW